jgi:hypothetical protein
MLRILRAQKTVVEQGVGANVATDLALRSLSHFSGETLFLYLFLIFLLALNKIFTN